MGLLEQLWDETVAGPRPDAGLGKLRKYSSFSPSSSPATAAAAAAASAGAPVSRSITIARPPALSVAPAEPGSVPSSPATPPDSPFGVTTPREESWRKQRRRAKGMEAAAAAAEPRSPTVYDWVVISSLDR